MKDIEKLVQSARSENFDEFKQQLFHFQMAVASIGDTSGGRANHEKSWMFVCGCLSSRFDDLRCVTKTYWKLQSQNGLSTKECWEHILSDFACVLLACSKTTAQDIIEDFKNETQPSMQSPYRSLHMFSMRVSEWISKQIWEGEPALGEIIQTHNLDFDNLVYQSVRTCNVSLLEHVMRTVDQNAKECFASYIAGNWTQKIIEQNTSEKISSKFNEFHPMYLAIQKYFNVDDFLDRGISDRLTYNGVDIGAMHYAINQAVKWDGVSNHPKVYDSQFRQFNVLLEHIELPAATKHMETLQKMYKLCPGELPRLQEWFNIMENNRLLSHIHVAPTVAKKKI